MSPLFFNKVLLLSNMYSWIVCFLNDKGQSSPGGGIFLNFKCKRIEEALIIVGCKISTPTEMKILMFVYMGVGKMLGLLESLLQNYSIIFPSLEY